MSKYQALAVVTEYWKPNSEYTTQIVRALRGKIQRGDFVVVSEKALATASGRILNEKHVEPGLQAKFLAFFWMRYVWGYCLGVLCGFGFRLLRRLREYPLVQGSKHKQVALEYAGLLQALMFGSEGGIDGSNLGYSFVSLPLSNVDEYAGKIQQEIERTVRDRVCVIIADTDKTYKFRNFYFTARPNPLKGIHSFGGVVAYVVGRLFNLKKSSTPLAVAGFPLVAGEALKITNIADRIRGPGSGATVWDMAARFGVGLDLVSWEMLSMLEHKPLVIVRRVF